MNIVKSLVNVVFINYHKSLCCQSLSMSERICDKTEDIDPIICTLFTYDKKALAWHQPGQTFALGEENLGDDEEGEEFRFDLSPDQAVN